MLVDLHTHSTFSDGTVTVPQMLTKAKGRGIKLLALTDHDTMAGDSLFKKACQERQIHGIIGAELSTSYQNNDLHILVLNPRRNFSILKNFLKEEQKKRQERAKKIIRNFERAGFFFSDETKNKLFAQPNIGKPQLARAIMAGRRNRAILKNRYRFYGNNLSRFIKTFFEKPNAVGYVPKPKPNSLYVINLIKKTGGKSVLAHPELDLRDEKTAAYVIGQFKKEGLWGLECPHVFIKKRDFFKNLARRLNLVITYGSDSHNGERLGVEIPNQEFEKLCALI